MNKIKNVINKIEKLYKSKSIFIFGSRARNDYLKNSDYEIGVLFNRNNYIPEGKLNKIIKPPTNIHIYPYKCDQFIKGKVDIPFQKNIFLREIILTGRTLQGDRIIEEILPPPITILDLIGDIKFSLGRGSDAVVSYRNGDKKTASILFYKSCLFGTRDLIVFLLRKFPLSYSDIYNLSKKINFREYKGLVYSAYKNRIGKEQKVNFNDLYRNISYLNKFIEKKLVSYYRNFGDKFLI